MSQFLKWAAEMDRAASVAEAESDGSPQFLAIIDGNRAIAEVLRQGAALEAAIAHAAAQFDEADAKRADDAPCSADSHFREAVRTIARTLPPSTAKVDRAAIWGELREMDRLHVDNAKLAADLAAAEDAISALDCHYGATEELGHDCKDASPCMREVLESERDTALADLAATCGILSRPSGGESSPGADHGVPAGTQRSPEPYLESGDSGFRRVEACFGLGIALLCGLTDLPLRGLHALVEALR